MTAILIIELAAAGSAAAEARRTRRAARRPRRCPGPEHRERRSRIAAIYPLEQVRAAYTELAGGHAHGKIVLSTVMPADAPPRRG